MMSFLVYCLYLVVQGPRGNVKFLAHLQRRFPFLDLLYSCHDVVPGVLLVPLPLQPLCGDVARDPLHLVVVVPRRLLVVLGLLLVAGLGLLLSDCLAWYEGREGDLLVAGAAGGHLAPLPGPRPGTDLPPLLVSAEQVVGAREEAREGPHGEGRCGGGSGRSQEGSEVGRDGPVWWVGYSSGRWSLVELNSARRFLSKHLSCLHSSGPQSSPSP